MDPVTALALAGNIAQFVEYAWTILRSGSEIYSSAKAATDQNSTLEDVTTQLSTLSYRLRPPEGTHVVLSETDQSIEALRAGCAELASELLREIVKLKISGDKTVVKSIGLAIKTEWNKGKIEKLENRLVKFRNQLTLHLIVDLRTQLRHLSTDQRERLEGMSDDTKQGLQEITDHLSSIQQYSNDTRANIALLTQAIGQGHSQLNHNSEKMVEDITLLREELRRSGEVETTLITASEQKYHSLTVRAEQIAHELGHQHNESVRQLQADVASLRSWLEENLSNLNLEADLYVPDMEDTGVEMGSSATPYIYSPIWQAELTHLTEAIRGLPSVSAQEVIIRHDTTHSCPPKTSEEARYIAAHFAESPVGMAICLRYGLTHMLYFPPIPSQEELSIWSEPGNTPRGVNKAAIASYRPSRSEKQREKAYNSFRSNCIDLGNAFSSVVAPAMSTLGYLWIMSRAAGANFEGMYDLIAGTTQCREAWIDQKKLLELHVALKLLLATTEHRHWPLFDDLKADQQVDWWCDSDKGEHLDICRGMLTLLRKHEKPLLPLSETDLWAATAVAELYGLGSIVETEEIYKNRKDLSYWWLCDPSPSTLSAPVLNPLASSNGWRALPLTPANESRLGGTRGPPRPEEVDKFEQAITEIVEVYESDENSYQDLEEAVSLRLILHADSTPSSRNNHMFFGNYEELEFLQTSGLISTWTKRFVKIALSLNRAIIFYRHLANPLSTVYGTDDEINLVDLQCNEKEFTIMSGPVFWHRIRGVHPDYRVQDFFQVGRLIWDISTTSIERGWQLCEAFLLRPHFETMDSATAVILMAYISSIGCEFDGTGAIPIPISMGSLLSTEWQKVLPQMSSLIETKECNQHFVAPVEENFPPFSTQGSSLDAVFLARRGQIRPLESPKIDQYGFTWTYMEFDFMSLFLGQPETYNIVISDRMGCIHNFQIGPQSVNVQKSLDSLRSTLRSTAIETRSPMSPESLQWIQVVYALSLIPILEVDGDNEPQNLNAAADDPQDLEEAHGCQQNLGMANLNLVEETESDQPACPSSSHDTGCHESGLANPEHTRQTTLFSPSTMAVPPNEAVIVNVSTKDEQAGGLSLITLLLPFLYQENTDEAHIRDRLLQDIPSEIESLRTSERGRKNITYVVQQNITFYSLLFDEAGLDGTDYSDLYLTYLSQQISSSQLPLDDIVMGIIGRILNLQFAVYIKDYSVNGTLELKRRTTLGTYEMAPLIWVLCTGPVKYEAIVTRSAAEVIRRDPSLAPKFRLSSLVDDAEIQPNAYTYMLGIAVMALLGADSDAVDLNPEDKQAVGLMFSTTIADGISKSQKYYLSHTDIFKNLNDIKRPVAPENTPRADNPGGNINRAPLAQSLQQTRTRFLRAMDEERTLHAGMTEAEAALVARQYCVALDKFTSVLRNALEAIHEIASRAASENIAKIAVQAAFKTTSIFRKLLLMPHAYVFLTVQARLIDMYDLNSTTATYERKLEHQFMLLARRMSRLPPDIAERFVNGGTDESNLLFEERGVWFDRMMPRFMDNARSAQALMR